MPFYSTVTCELRSGVVPSLSLSFMSPSSSSSDIACSYVAPLREPIASFLNVGDMMLAFDGVDYSICISLGLDLLFCILSVLFCDAVLSFDHDTL